MENRFTKFDEILAVRDEVLDYADGLNPELQRAEQCAAKQVITTQGYDLGIVCPSLVRHIVIGGHKKGKIIKTIPEGKSYQIISYDADGNPIAYRYGNQFGLRDAHFFFPYKGFIWAAQMGKNGRLPYDGPLHRMQYDAQGRILSYYTIERSYLCGEEYTYPEDGSIECLFYRYLPNKCGTSKDVSAGYEGSPMEIYRYLIDEDTISGYVKTGEEFVLTRTYQRKAARRTVSPCVQFTRQLDKLLQQASLPEHCGVYFELYEGNDDTYQTYLTLTAGFDAEDEEWACDVETEVGVIDMPKHTDMEWQKIQDTAVRLIGSYLRKGKYKDKLLACAGIGAGFGEGDLVIVQPV